MCVRTACENRENAGTTDEDMFAVRHAWVQKLRSNLLVVCTDGGGHRKIDTCILATMLKGLGTNELTLTKYPSSSVDYLLFFDGGSRGNPGPGRSGAVVVRLGHQPELV
jgi:hypothetical protein